MVCKKNDKLVIKFRETTNKQKLEILLANYRIQFKQKERYKYE